MSEFIHFSFSFFLLIFLFYVIYDLAKERYEFDNAGVRPIRASGTLWISHKIGALTQIADKFGLYITHLKYVSTDTSYRAKESNRMKSYLNKWRNSKILVNFCFYLKLLKLVQFLPPLLLEKLKNKDINHSNQTKTSKK